VSRKIGVLFGSTNASTIVKMPAMTDSAKAAVGFASTLTAKAHRTHIHGHVAYQETVTGAGVDLS